ncbi:polysaccharide biosynthesis C-terminal domain-containing protein [Candidatus Saccharibacteria bacterium]|nr:polysaccharide biosynthesis C-terminal domain-containing protein [Candidatus Saccharibacteria bacterium]
MITSIASAVINIVIDLVLINFIGLYAAVLSTALAYLIMVIYRHFDLKRYINITYKFFDIALMLAGFIIICTLYFLNTFGLNIICMLLAVAYGLIQNRKIISSILKHKKFDKK